MTGEGLIPFSDIVQYPAVQYTATAEVTEKLRKPFRGEEMNIGTEMSNRATRDEALFSARQKAIEDGARHFEKIHPDFLLVSKGKHLNFDDPMDEENIVVRWSYDLASMIWNPDRAV